MYLLIEKHRSVGLILKQKWGKCLQKTQRKLSIFKADSEEANMLSSLWKSWYKCFVSKMTFSGASICEWSNWKQLQLLFIQSYYVLFAFEAEMKQLLFHKCRREGRQEDTWHFLTLDHVSSLFLQQGKSFFVNLPVLRKNHFRPFLRLKKNAS